MSDDIFGFLGGESQNALPEGSGVFANRGFAGKLNAVKLWKFYSAEDLSLYGLPYQNGVDYQVRGADNSWWYYFVDQDAAKKSAEAVKAFSPGLVWHFEMPTSSVLNFTSDGAEKWGQVVSADTRITTLGSTKYRHEFHLIVLPGLVDALARRAGFIKERVFHINELLEGLADEEMTDQLHWRLIGHPDATAADAENMQKLMDALGVEKAHAVALGTEQNVPAEFAELSGKVKIHYHYSLFWVRRAQLWAALGESNAEAYLPTGKATTEDGKKSEASSERLSKCLNVAEMEWVAPIWAQFHMIKDPSMGTAYTSKKTNRVQRNYLPFVSEIYASESAAVEALGESAVNAPVSEAAPSGGYPPTPKEWGEENTQSWKDILSGEKKDLNGVMPEGVPLVILSKKLSCTAEDIKAWWGFV